VRQLETLLARCDALVPAPTSNLPSVCDNSALFLGRGTQFHCDGRR
jgi:hypothetical protein